MDWAWPVAAAFAAVLASWVFNVLVYLVWRPYAIARKLRAQGVRGPGYKFFVGSLGEMKRLRGEAAGARLEVGDHDFIPMVQPHFRKWIPLYGTFQLLPKPVAAASPPVDLAVRASSCFVF